MSLQREAPDRPRSEASRKSSQRAAATSSQNSGRPTDLQAGSEHVAIVDLGDVRLQRDVEKVHRLGPRPLYEMMIELGHDRLLRVEIERLVARYAALDPAVVEALGGDRFPERGR